MSRGVPWTLSTQAYHVGLNHLFNHRNRMLRSSGHYLKRNKLKILWLRAAAKLINDVVQCSLPFLHTIPTSNHFHTIPNVNYLCFIDRPTTTPNATSSPHTTIACSNRVSPAMQRRLQLLNRVSICPPFHYRFAYMFRSASPHGNDFHLTARVFSCRGIYMGGVHFFIDTHQVPTFRWRSWRSKWFWRTFGSQQWQTTVIWYVDFQKLGRKKKNLHTHFCRHKYA